MRTYNIKAWEYVVIKFQEISSKKKYAIRYRLDYFAFINGNKTPKSKFIGFFVNILGFLSEIRFIVIGQFINQKTSAENIDKYIFVSNNNSFLKTIIPIALKLLESDDNILILCPANHYKALKKKLPAAIIAKLHSAEQININSNSNIKFLTIIKSVIYSIADCIWFAFQPLQNNWQAASGFGRHALIQHYYYKFWESTFKFKKCLLLSADDKYLWESFLFSCALETASESFVFQHGKLSDIYYPTMAKKFCLWGSRDAAIMINEYKAIPSEIVITGSPYFDQVYKTIKDTEILPKKDRKYISFLGQPYYRTLKQTTIFYTEALKWFYKLSANKKIALKFILKPHPHDHLSFYKNIPSEVEVLNDNIIKVLEESLIMITIDSTSVLEAAVCKTPSIQLLPKGYIVFADESPTGISLKAETYEEFEAIALKLYNESEYYDKVISESADSLNLYFDNLGHSLEKIKELLLNDSQSD